MHNLHWFFYAWDCTRYKSLLSEVDVENKYISPAAGCCSGSGRTSTATTVGAAAAATIIVAVAVLAAFAAVVEP